MADPAGTMVPAPSIMNAQRWGAMSEMDAQIRGQTIDSQDAQREHPRPQRPVFVASHAEAIHIPPRTQTHMIPIADDGPQFPLS